MNKATKMVLITGNTYPVKDQLKALGGKWDVTSKGWLVPENKAQEAFALVPPSITTKVQNVGPFNNTSRPLSGFVNHSGCTCGNINCDGCDFLGFDEW